MTTPLDLRRLLERIGILIKNSNGPIQQNTDDQAFCLSPNSPIAATATKTTTASSSKDDDDILSSARAMTASKKIKPFLEKAESMLLELRSKTVSEDLLTENAEEFQEELNDLELTLRRYRNLQNPVYISSISSSATREPEMTLRSRHLEKIRNELLASNPYAALQSSHSPQQNDYQQQSFGQNATMNLMAKASGKETEKEDGDENHLNAQRKIHEKLSEEMLTLAKQLKTSTQSINEIILNDNKLLDESELIAESNLESLKGSSKSIKSVYSKAWRKSLFVYLMIFVVCLLSAACFVLIRVFPKGSL